MNRCFIPSLLLLGLPALAQERPTVRHYARPGCGDCAAITSALRGLETRWQRRVAAVIASRPRAPTHGHDVELFLRPKRDPAELTLTLRWTDAFGRPTLDPTGQVNARVGDAGYGIAGDLRGPALSRHGGWILLRSKLREVRAAYAGKSRWGAPIVLDADRRVPAPHLLRALEVVAQAVDADAKRWPVGGAALKVPARDRVEPPEPRVEPPSAGPPSPAPPRRSAQIAVRNALAWLAQHQERTGAWSPVSWRSRCRRSAACAESRVGLHSAGYEVGLTALALLAFEGGGHNRLRGKHRRAVAKGVAWLLTQQRADGSFGSTQGEQVYNHAIAATALCRLANGDRKIRTAAGVALDWIVRAQNPGLGWKYGARSGRNDTSVTAWMVQALAAGRRSKLPVALPPFAGARRWVERVTTAAGETGYEAPAGGSAYLPPNDGKYDALPVMTAAGVRVLQLTGARPSALAKSASRLRAALPRWPRDSIRSCNFYYWYWGSEASYGLGTAPWRLWRRALESALLPRQETKGCAKGSWPEAGEWCLAGGRVYGTAINVLSLTTARRLKGR